MVKAKARAILEAHRQLYLALADMEAYTGVRYSHLQDMLTDSLGAGDMDAHIERLADAIVGSDEFLAETIGELSDDGVRALYRHIESLESGTLKVRIGGGPGKQWRFCEMKVEERSC